MASSTHDDHIEPDNYSDWSVIGSRLESFRNYSGVPQVPAERLARAGFYFTGPADRVRCFSCQRTVENWQKGDAPVERHREASPTCTYLSCVHGLRPAPTLANGQFDEEAEDAQFRLRRGEVVDESTYPLASHMRSEEARLRSFDTWPASAPVRPQALAQAGLYYLGDLDRVQCFCCGGGLASWEAGDEPWSEHEKYYPNCFFVLGHDVGNEPSEFSEMPPGRGDNRPTSMVSFEERLRSFSGTQHPIDHERLAQAGFYNIGAPDRVKCFRCGGLLKDWQPEEDPWEEHAKHYPGCSFLLAEKGQEYVSSVQLGDPRGRSSAASNQNGFSRPEREKSVMQSEIAQRAIELGLDPTKVERTILEKIQQTGEGYATVEPLVEDILCGDVESQISNGEDPLEKLRKLQREKQCKVCMDRDISIVFIPCGHLVTCSSCSQSLTKCPICCAVIDQKIKTYIS